MPNTFHPTNPKKLYIISNNFGRTTPNVIKSKINSKFARSFFLSKILNMPHAINIPSKIIKPIQLNSSKIKL